MTQSATPRKNLEHMKFDLSKKAASEFVETLKALLARMLMNDKDISTITGDFSSEEATKVIRTLKEKADSLYNDLLSSAIEFCNDDLSVNLDREGKTKESDDVELSQTMKESIREYCKASSEAERYEHLVSVLNTILCNFRSHEFKDLITPAMLGDSELIFITNDPAVIKTDVTGSTERKPDIIATSLDTLNSWFEESKGHSWTKWRSGINNGSKPPAGLDRGWLDVLQPWELKMFKKRLQPERLGKAYSGQDLTAIAPGDDQVTDTAGGKESSQAVNGSPTLLAKRKRKAEDYIEPMAFKKKKRSLENNPPRQSHTSDAQYASAPAPSVEQLCDPDVELQLATYALERSCAAWNITHTTGISLLDTQLELWYYDSQGAIQTHHIDILQQLPLFVVMVMIFQRFDSRMWGVRDTKIFCAEGSKIYHVIEKIKKGPHFELRGRRPFTALVSEDPEASYFLEDDPERVKTGTNAGVQDASINNFFKAAWPEIPRKKEPAILHEPHCRADELLQQPFRSYVKDHIPEVDGWAELPDTSTVLIRCLLGLSTENGRVQLWMVSPILEPAQTLVPQAFWVAFWEAIRCHYLLWRIGIAHGDISLSNIMYNADTKKCILNDYDLSSVMDPGTEVPDRKGYERTGTRPFMALDLLKPEGVAGHTQRRYRHDLESFCWVLVWVGACVQDGKETIPSTYEMMVMGSHTQVRKEKSDLFVNSTLYTTTQDYHDLEDVVVRWLMWWHRFQLNMDVAVDQQHWDGIPVKEEPAEYFVDGLIKSTTTRNTQPVPMEIDWLQVEVSASSWREYQEHHSLLGDSSS